MRGTAAARGGRNAYRDRPSAVRGTAEDAAPLHATGGHARARRRPAPLTLPVGARTGGGIAALSGRKDGRPGGEATKCRMVENGGLCVYPAGDGRAAGGLPRGVAEDKTVQSSSMAKRTSGLAAPLHGPCRPHVRVDRILPTPGSHRYEVHDLHTRNGRAGLRPNCAAAMPHMLLASKAATTVDSVGGREEYGFDLASSERRAGRGRSIDAPASSARRKTAFHIALAGAKVGNGGGGRAHG